MAAVALAFRVVNLFRRMIKGFPMTKSEENSKPHQFRPTCGMALPKDDEPEMSLAPLCAIRLPLGNPAPQDVERKRVRIARREILFPPHAQFGYPSNAGIRTSSGFGLIEVIGVVAISLIVVLGLAWTTIK